MGSENNAMDSAIERRRRQNREAQRKRRSTVKAQIQELQEFKDLTLRAATQGHLVPNPGVLPTAPYNPQDVPYTLRSPQCVLPSQTATTTTAAPSQVMTPPMSFAQFEEDDFLNQFVNKDLSTQPFWKQIQSPLSGVKNGPEGMSPMTSGSPTRPTSRKRDRAELSDAQRDMRDDSQSVPSGSPAPSPHDIGPLYQDPMALPTAGSISLPSSAVTKQCNAAGRSSHQGQAQRALNMAVLHGQVSMVGLLLEYGVDVNAQDMTGRTALHDAVEANDVKMVELLLQNGADQSCVDNCGMTALEISASVGSLEVAEVLLKVAGGD